MSVSSLIADNSGVGEKDSRMKEEDIRPERLMQEYHALYEEDVRSLLSKSAMFVDVPCPACRSGMCLPLFEKEGFKFVECKDCGTVYVNPRPTAGMLGEYYAGSKGMALWNDKIFPASEDTRREKIFAPRARRVAELCKKHGVTTGFLLDAGAGFGTFCEEIVKLGLFDKVAAVEPSRSLAQNCRKKGLDVIEDTIENVEFANADVITNFELIEHLFDPEFFLKGCSRALADGGLLMITTPNFQGFDLSILGRLSENVAGPNHLNYFNIKSLCRLLDGCGFEVLETLTPGLLDAEIVRKKVVSGDLDVSGRPFLKSLLIDNWDSMHENFQSFLADNRLSSHLWVVARKH